MWQSAERHPVRTLIVFAVMALIIADSARRTFASGARHTWPLVAGAALALATIPASALIRTRREFDLVRTQLLLAFAFAPVIIVLGAVAAGAAVWLLWAGVGLALGLVCWWAWDSRRPQPARADG